jgi:hypothetical protein
MRFNRSFARAWMCCLCCLEILTSMFCFAAIESKWQVMAANSAESNSPKNVSTTPVARAASSKIYLSLRVTSIWEGEPSAHSQRSGMACICGWWRLKSRAHSALIFAVLLDFRPESFANVLQLKRIQTYCCEQLIFALVSNVSLCYLLMLVMLLGSQKFGYSVTRDY